MDETSRARRSEGTLREEGMAIDVTGPASAIPGARLRFRPAPRGVFLAQIRMTSALFLAHRRPRAPPVA